MPSLLTPMIRVPGSITAGSWVGVSNAERAGCLRLRKKQRRFRQTEAVSLPSGASGCSVLPACEPGRGLSVSLLFSSPDSESSGFIKCIMRP